MLTKLQLQTFKTVNKLVGAEAALRWLQKHGTDDDLETYNSIPVISRYRLEDLGTFVGTKRTAEFVYEMVLARSLGKVWKSGEGIV